MVYSMEHYVMFHSSANLLSSFRPHHDDARKFHSHKYSTNGAASRCFKCIRASKWNSRVHMIYNFIVPLHPSLQQLYSTHTDKIIYVYTRNIAILTDPDRI